MRQLMLAVLLVPACLSACRTYPTAPSEAVVAAQRHGGAVLTVAPELARRVQALVPAHTASSLSHLVYKLFSLAGGAETELAATDVLDSSKFTAPVSFTHLRPDSSYRVRAYAYASPGTGALISVPASSFVDVTVTNDDRPTLAKLRVTLTDVPFDGQTTSSGTTIVSGGYSAPAASAAIGSATSVSTLAGGSAGYADGTGGAAKFQGPRAIVLDAYGNLYVADTLNARIRKVTPTGVVTTFVGGTPGQADGGGTAAQFVEPSGLAIDPMGNLYVADGSGHRIRKVSPTGVVTTLAGSTAGDADGTGPAAQFNNPQGLAYGQDGYLYVADCGNHRLRRVSPGGVVTTFAGSGAGFADGTGTAARFNGPQGLAVDAGGSLIVADTGNHRIRKVSPAGEVVTLAGSGSAGYADGPGATASFDTPVGVALDPIGNVIVADRLNQCLRRITPAGLVATLAGTPTSAGALDGPADTSGFSLPSGLAVTGLGDVYVAEAGNHRLRKLR